MPSKHLRMNIWSCSRDSMSNMMTNIFSSGLKKKIIDVTGSRSHFTPTEFSVFYWFSCYKHGIPNGIYKDPLLENILMIGETISHYKILVKLGEARVLPMSYLWHQEAP